MTGRLHTAALAAVTLVATLAFAEGLARLSGLAAHAFTDPIYRRSAAPGVVYELRPGARGWTWGLTPVAVNHLGLRGPEIARTKPPGVHRIGVFGDSVAFGQGVPEAQTFPRVLERASVGLQVLNFAVPGYGVGNMVSTFVEKGAALDLDTAVLAVIVEDYGLHRAHTVDRYGYPAHAAGAIAPGRLKNVLRRLHLAYVLRDLWWSATAPMQPALRALDERPDESALAAATWTRARAELQRFVVAARRRGITPIYLAVGRPMPAALAHIVDEAGFRLVVDSRAVTSDYPSEVLQLSRRDGHPSVLCHRLFAAHLQLVLNELRPPTVERTLVAAPRGARRTIS